METFPKKAVDSLEPQEFPLAYLALSCNWKTIWTNYAVITWKSDLAFSDKDLGDFLVGKCPLGKSQDPRLSPGSLFLLIIATTVEPGSAEPTEAVDSFYFSPTL